MQQTLIIPTAKGNYTATPQDGNVRLKAPSGEVQILGVDDFKKFLIENTSNITKTQNQDTFTKTSKELKNTLPAQKATKGATNTKNTRAIASLLCPGLGQAMKGENKKGAAFFIGELVLSSAAFFVTASPAVSVSCMIAAIGCAIWSAVDAYKH